MPSNLLRLELDQKAIGQVLESLAERLLRLEQLHEDEVDEDSFADAKNDAVALRPLYIHVREQAIRRFGRSILESSGTIAELDSIYSL